MSVTRLKRKHRKNIARANNKQRIIKNMLRTPVLKNVDLEELKSRFTTAAPVAAVAAVAADTSVIDKAKHAAADLVAAVSHSAVGEKVADAVEAVSHSAVVEKVKDLASDAVDAAKHAVKADDEATEAKAAE